MTAIGSRGLQLAAGDQAAAATGGAVGLALVLLALPVNGRDWTEIAIAAAIGLALVGTAVVVRARPAAGRLALPLGYLLMAAILKDATGGVSGFGGLFLLPVIAVALFAGRLELLLVLGAMLAANVIPILAVGEPAYPTTLWRGAVVQVGVAVVAGLTIQRLVGATRAQNQRLRELDRTKDEFLSLVSHELRTPLTSIVGYLEMVPLDPDGRLSPSQSSFLATIERNVRRLVRLVEDLLFVARLDEGRIRLSHDRLDLQEMLAQARATATPTAERRSVTVELEVADLPPVVGDRDRIAQMLDNLVSNAVKFTPEGGRVTLRASNGSGAVRVEIADTGVGIPADEVGHLFERFFRASTVRSAETPGTGLGLAISQSIAHAHGTELTVASTLGEGTTFSFELPAHA